MGNILAQLLTLGEIKTRHEAQALIKNSETTNDYEVADLPNRDQIYARYLELAKGGQ